MLHANLKTTARRLRPENRKTSTLPPAPRAPRTTHRAPRARHHGDATIFFGDCHQRLRLLPDHSADLVLVDPPYGITKCGWDTPLDFDQIWRELNRVVKPGGTVIIFGLGSFSASIMRKNLGGFRFRCKLIWEKTQAVGSFNFKSQPMRAHEDIMVFCRENSTFNLAPVSHYPAEAVGRAASTGRAHMPSLLLFKKDSQTCSLHSTQKPVLLLQLLIEVFSNSGDTVLDFSTGSGSTGVAALLTGRVFIGIEMLSRYFHIASERLRYVVKYGTEIPREFAKSLKARKWR